jgi:hypothetical protein
MDSSEVQEVQSSDPAQNLFESYGKLYKQQSFPFDNKKIMLAVTNAKIFLCLC